MKILVTGSVAYDLLLHYEGSFTEAIDPNRLEELSMAFVTPHFERHHGGTGANIAWNLRLLNQDPLLVSTVGNDGGAYMEILEKRKISTSHVEVLKKAATATAIVASDNHEHQITFYHPGADSLGSWPKDLSKEKKNIAYAIIAPRDPTVMKAAMQWCQKNKVPYLFDPGQQVLSFSKKELEEAVKGSHGVVTNAYEWGLLSTRLAKSITEILKLTKMIIVTHAEQGLTVYSRDETLVLPACETSEVVNPTGAGDGFRAGLLTGLSAKWSIMNAARLGASLASFIVEQEGALLDSIDLNAVMGRAETTYGEVLPALP